jgi:hypothetical protein
MQQKELIITNTKQFMHCICLTKTLIHINYLTCKQ